MTKEKEFMTEEKEFMTEEEKAFLKEQERALNRAREKVAKDKLHQTLKARIDQLCKEKGVSYYNLSYKSSIPMTTLTHILNGSSNNPGIYTMVKLCDGLGVTLSEFFDTKEFEDAIVESRDEK